MKVYRSSSHAKVHFDPHCWRRTQTNTVKRPLRAYELADLIFTAAEFCDYCAPADMPRLPSFTHRRCLICYPSDPYAKPCRHNGGVPVRTEGRNVNQHRTDPVTTIYTKWRWPENVRGAPIAIDVLTGIA